ncbi:MAG: PaaI family thioesterase [Parvularculaceae bacterium]
MSRQTSQRHTDILDGYMQGGSRFNEWAEAKLGHFKLTAWEWGALAMDWAIDERFVMPDGVMFGGHVASVADHVLGLTTMTVLAENDDRFRTSRLETNFFRPVTAPHAHIDARIVNTSRSLIYAEADFLNAEGKLAARVSAVQARR